MFLHVRKIFLLVILFLFYEQSAFAKSLKVLRDGPYSFYLAGNMFFSRSLADQVAGATYTKKYTNPMAGVAGLGVRLFGFLYLGARYEHWFAGRTITQGTAQTDTLKYQALGGEVGYYTGNPRVYWIFSISYFYPLDLSVNVVSSTNRKFTSAVKVVGYEARLLLGIKLSSLFSLRIEGGYRYANFGNLTSAGTPYVSGAGKFDLSGPMAGIGIGFHF